jgi:hypothetical protein
MWKNNTIHASKYAIVFVVVDVVVLSELSTGCFVVLTVTTTVPLLGMLDQKQNSYDDDDDDDENKKNEALQLR